MLTFFFSINKLFIEFIFMFSPLFILVLLSFDKKSSTQSFLNYRLPLPLRCRSLSLLFFLYHLIMVTRREEKYVLLAYVIWTKSCLIFLFLIVWSIGKLTFFIWKVEEVVINISLSSEEINIVFRYNSKTAGGFPIVFVSFLLNKDVILRVNVTYFLGCYDLIFIQYWILLWNIGLQMVL